MPVLGYATWHLVAPFDNQKGVGFDKVYPPEKGVDLTATYEGKGNEQVAWKPYDSKNSQGSMAPLFNEIVEAADVLLLCGDLTDYGLAEEARDCFPHGLAQLGFIFQVLG